MTITHLTEEEIQEYAISGSASGANIIEHIDGCEACQTRVEPYKLLFNAILQQEDVYFNFNLQELVFAKHHLPKSGVSKNIFSLPLFVWLSIIFTGFLLFIFRRTLIAVFTGTPPMAAWLMITTAFIVLSILCIDMYKKYNRKMNSLDFY